MRKHLCELYRDWKCLRRFLGFHSRECFRCKAMLGLEEFSRKAMNEARNAGREDGIVSYGEMVFMRKLFDQ